MTQAGWAALQQILLLRYEELKRRLTRRLGSAELAGDALHDTWLRLERGGDLAQVRSPDTYLFQVAINVARDNLRAENRLVSTSDAKVLLGIADEAPDAERDAESRSDLRVLMAVMAELPPRQKAILLAARVEGLGRSEIARRYRVSVRYVHRELQAAQDYCAERLEKIAAGEFISMPRESSFKQESLRTANAKPRTPGIEE
ncbi:RNA polymerase sigma factor [Bradyrhizobium neotropicale]|uniref:RNA polymerase sigma factor n=1 Tax=Bradyrhizobium neotropicale TaxID=1497615 RepID=UPI001AD669CC|nr:RNA polymerase sigma factor [Bradyrhizobium neotropicale]MBO4224088.1 sigma-70 family RNA polymerase sigma factor [Bradyrhizobium neotropicale]